MDFEPCFKVYNLVSIRPKSMKLGQMTNLNVIFHMAELQFETRPSSQLTFGMAYDMKHAKQSTDFRIHLNHMVTERTKTG